MTTNHIDQLAQWWHDAEEGTGKAGDVIIEHDDSPNFETPSYVVFTLGRDEHENLTYRRILARAPKHKPALHDAVAAIATFRDENGTVTGVWVPEGMPNYWEGPEGDVVAASALENVTPLIEAKVTDEMVERFRAAWADRAWDRKAPHANFVRPILAAALGIDTE